jgi:hypothetical protein
MNQDFGGLSLSFEDRDETKPQATYLKYMHELSFLFSASPEVTALKAQMAADEDVQHNALDIIELATGHKWYDAVIRVSCRRALVAAKRKEQQEKAQEIEESGNSAAWGRF